MNGEGRIFKRKRGRWFYVAYYGPDKNGDWKEIREAVRPRTDDEEKAQESLHRRRRSAENQRDGIARICGRARRSIPTLTGEEPTASSEPSAGVRFVETINLG